MSEEDTLTSLTNKASSLVGIATGAIRSIIYQLTSFYLRTPLKLFRPARFDYMAYMRVVLTGDLIHGKRPYNFFKDSSVGLFTRGVKKYGWKVVPERILPPLLANSVTGLVLYTSYLTSLQYFNDFKQNFLVNPHPWDTWRAGFIAGMCQSIAAAPIDAIYARSSAAELIGGQHTNLWVYGWSKLREIGVIGVFGGFGLSLVKESFGFAWYFCIFETVKNRAHNYIDSLLAYRRLVHSLTGNGKTDLGRGEEKFIKSTFVFIAGVSAAFTLQLVQYPFNKIQRIHLGRLEALDMYSRVHMPRAHHSRRIHIYYHAYLDTLEHVYFMQRNSKQPGLRWLYKGFTRNTLAIIPGTTAGLMLLEYMRSSLADASGAPPLV